MKLRDGAFLLSIINLATSVSSAVEIQCKSELEVKWTYDQVSNTSQFSENGENLVTTTLKLDLGFIKLSKPGENDNLLFRQSSIVKNKDNPLNLSVRYESSSRKGMSQSSLVISDPMCVSGAVARASIFETSEFSFFNSVYSCECLSPVFDRKNFVFRE